MMFEIYNTLIHSNFIMHSHECNKPMNIIYEDSKTKTKYYLSCHDVFNIVDLYTHDDNSGRQKWILEKDDVYKDIYYIKMCFQRYNGTQYLGCPNKSGVVYLYTSKNAYTRWTINSLSECIYSIEYAGVKFDASKVTLVVARYNENVDWVLPYDDIAVVYNKGPADIPHFKNMIILKNIGREGHIYLHHIINAYDNLSERVIFLQGDPFVHNNTILFGIDNYEKGDSVQPLGLDYLREVNIPPLEYRENSKTITKYGLEYLLIPITGDLFSKEFEDIGLSNIIKWARIDYNSDMFNNISIINGFFIRSKFSCNFKDTDVIDFTFSALFSVIRNNILMNSLQTYVNLCEELISIDEQGGRNGYILERVWLYIFKDRRIEVICE